MVNSELIQNLLGFWNVSVVDWEKSQFHRCLPDVW